MYNRFVFLGQDICAKNKEKADILLLYIASVQICICLNPLKRIIFQPGVTYHMINFPKLFISLKENILRKERMICTWVKKRDFDNNSGGQFFNFSFAIYEMFRNC